MSARTLRDALMDTRGVIASFESLGLPEDECTPFAAEAINTLDDTIERVLLNTGDTIPPRDVNQIETRVRELLLVSDGCGDRTRVLMLDIQTVLGRFLELEPV